MISSPKSLFKPYLLLASLAFASLPMATMAHPRMAELPMTQMVERDIVYENGERVAAEEGLMWVPENRNVENSRKIPVHFVRVKAENPTLPPQFYMPGGPGGHFSASNSDEDPLSNNWFKMILEVSGGKRDVVFVNQRGNLNVPLSTALNVHIPQRSLSTTTPTQNEADITAKAILEAQTHYTSKGNDLAGYDIKHLVDDVDAVRQVLGYEKIAFYTLSFGSQWSFSYIATYPAHVDRAVLFGVEPLDHAYDSPAYLDLAVARVLSEADNSPAAQCMKPEGGFLASVKRSKEKLNKNPKSVTVVNEDGEQSSVLVTGDAFINMIKGLETGEGYLRSRSAAIPKLVAEVERGEYDNLAKAILASRSPNNAHMIWALIDNSLGISKERDRKLKQEAKTALVGELNATYRATRNITETKKVSDDFRAFKSIDVPILMVQGDIDFSTPYENAVEQLPYLENGALLTVRGGTHVVAYDLWEENNPGYDIIRTFLTADAEDLPKGEFTATLAPLDFTTGDLCQ